MRSQLLILLIIAFCQTVYSQKSNCEDFKTGKFIYRSEGLPDILLTRTAIEQIETVQNTNEEIRGSIFWISDCSYQFTFTKTPYQTLLGKTMVVELNDVKIVSQKEKFCLKEQL